MRYPLSESQLEVLKLESVVGEEVNTLSFRVLFREKGSHGILEEAARIVERHFPLLSAVIDRNGSNTYGYTDRDCVVGAQHFESIETCECWCDCQSRNAMDITKCCAEITPVYIHNDREGYYIQLHHAIADGWAASLLVGELVKVYRCLKEGQLPELHQTQPYETYVSAEQNHYLSKRGQREASFWKEFLSAHAEGALLSDKVSGDFSAVRYTEEVSECVVDRLNAFGRAKNRTIQSLIMAACAAAYSRMEDTQFFSIGTLLMNRLNANEQHMMGNCFVTAPLPIEIKKDNTFDTLTDEITDSLYSLLRRQRTSYTRLLSQAFEVPPTKPLFDMILNFQDYSDLEVSDCEYVWYPPAKQLETLQIGVFITARHIQIHYDYRPDCISIDKVRQFHTRIEAILENMGEELWTLPISVLPQVSERQRVLMAQWNQTTHEYPKNETLFSLFERQLSIRKDQPALFFKEMKLTYAEFDARIRRIAAILLQHGVKTGQIIGVMSERSFEMMVAIYAIIRCGAAYMPIGTDTPEERLLFMLEDSKSPCLLTQSSMPFSLPSGIARIDLDRIDWNGEKTESAECTRPELPAYVIYTSGSTGLPKGVLISHRSIVDRIHWMNRMFGLCENDIILQKTPYTFDVSVWELFWWSNYGASLAILPREAHKDPGQIIEAVKAYGVTKMHFVPSMLSAFLTYAQAVNCSVKLDSLRQVFASGEALMPAHVQKFYKLFGHAELINLYGPTECTVDVSYFRCPKEVLSSVPIGKPVDNTQLHVLDKNLQPLPIGAPGELCVSGNLVGIGYLNRAELTDVRFVPNPFGEGRLYRTGDLTYWNAQGEIEYIGRLDFQVKLRGQRLELGEIERCMTDFPGIRESVALVQCSGDENAQLVAYYTGSQSVSVQMLRAHLKSKLPGYMVPQGFMHLDAMPLTVSGKTDRKKLPPIPVENANEQDTYAAPKSRIEKDLCEVFARALQIPEQKVGRTFHFFEHGGTSLTAIMLLTDVFSQYHIQLKDIYNHPTPAELGMYIENQVMGPDMADEEAYDEEDYVVIDTTPVPNPGIPEGKSVLITGTTGFLGIHLLNEVLRSSADESVICLVRDREKLIRIWAEMFPNERFPQERVVVVCGDISKEHLGLSADDYSMCIEHTAAIYHCAADVRHFGQWEKSYAVNTLGTQHVIELCFAAGAVLHHVSTISVNGYVLTSIGDKLVDEFTEENLYIGQRYRENVYVHSKYLAEKRVLDARRDGLNANIYRIGNLLWRTTDGKFQSNRDVHDFYMLTHAFLELGADVREFADLEVDLTAVDSCARAIRVLSEAQLGQVYHIMSPYPMALHEYLQTVSKKEIRTLPMDEFKPLLQKHESDPKFGFLLAYMSANENLDASVFPVERNEKTIMKLKQLGFIWEKPTVEYARYVL